MFVYFLDGTSMTFSMLWWWYLEFCVENG